MPLRVSLASLLVLPLILLAGCASKSLREAEAQAYLKHAGEPVEEVRAFRLTNWRPLDRDHLVVWRSVNDAFVIRVSGPCPNLEFADRIAVHYRAPVLRSRFDWVMVEGQRCPIDVIRPVDYRDVRRELRGVRAAG
jgi:hypothetical protein